MNSQLSLVFHNPDAQACAYKSDLPRAAPIHSKISMLCPPCLLSLVVVLKMHCQAWERIRCQMHSTFSNSCCVCICCGSYSEHWREKPVCLRTMHRWDRWVDCTLLHRRRSTGRDGRAFPYIRFSETSKYHIARQPLFHFCRLFVCYVLIIQFLDDTGDFLLI